MARPQAYLWLIGLVVPSLAFLAIGLHAGHRLGRLVLDRAGRDPRVVPLIDLLAGLDRSNPPDDVIERLEQDRYYRWITFAFLPVQYLGFAAAFWLVARGGRRRRGQDRARRVDRLHRRIGINTAHELGRKKESHERWLSKIALAQSFYGHFYIEHNRGHHVRVATPEDPASSASAKLLPLLAAHVFGSLKSAWRLERKRYARRDRTPSASATTSSTPG